MFPDINKYVDNFDSLKSLNDFSSLQRNEIFHTLRNKIEEERQALQEERIAIIKDVVVLINTPPLFNFQYSLNKSFG